MTHVTPAAQKKYSYYNNRPCSWWLNYTSLADTLRPVLSDSITVHVYLDSVAQINAAVYLYYRINGKLIGKGITDKNGLVVFTGLNNADSAAYFAIAQISGSLNALILDKL